MSNFKDCPNCGFSWKTRDEFLQDNNVLFVGYQVNFAKLVAGYFMFNHSCNTTFSVDVYSFEDLYDGPIFEERVAGTDECPGYCLNQGNFHPCKAKCECAFVREIIQILKKREITKKIMNKG